MPAKDIERVVSQLLRFGKVIQPGIGVEILPDHITQQFGIRGVIIKKVIPNSSAASGGLQGLHQDGFGQIQLGDIIVGVDDEPISNYGDLYNALENKKIGATIRVKYLRHGEPHRVDLQTIPITP